MGRFRSQGVLLGATELGRKQVTSRGEYWNLARQNQGPIEMRGCGWFISPQKDMSLKHGHSVSSGLAMESHFGMHVHKYMQRNPGLLSPTCASLYLNFRVHDSIDRNYLPMESTRGSIEEDDLPFPSQVPSPGILLLRKCARPLLKWVASTRWVKRMGN